MKKLWGLVSVLFVSSFIAYAPAHAQSSASTGIEEKGAEYLLFAEIPSVSSSGFFKTKVTNAPGSTIVINQQQIDYSPARDLQDLISYYVPSMAFSTHEYHGSLIGTRGILLDNSAKTLVMVDNTPLNSAWEYGYGNQYQSPLIGDLSGVEVMSGPGAIMHGSGAIGGFINMVSKTGASNPGWFADVERGFIEQGYKAETGYGTSFGQNKNLYLYAGIAHAVGVKNEGDLWDAKDNGIYQSHTANLGAGEYAYGSPEGFPDWKFSSLLNYNDFTLKALFQETNTYWGSPSPHYAISSRPFFHMTDLTLAPSYTFHFTDTDELALQLTGMLMDTNDNDDHDLDSMIGHSETHFEFKPVFKTTRFDRNSIAVGLSVGTRAFKSNDAFFHDNPDVNPDENIRGGWKETAFFGEDVINFTDKWLFSVGTRYDEVFYHQFETSVNGSDVNKEKPQNAHNNSWRAATSYAFTPSTVAKLSYQEGFRYPDARNYSWHSYFSAVSVAGGFSPLTQLKPEKMNSTELNLHQELSSIKVSLDANVYYNVYSDTIHWHQFSPGNLAGVSMAEYNYVVSQAGWMGSFMNATGSFRSLGFELIGKWQPIDSTGITLMYGFSRPTDLPSSVNDSLDLATTTDNEWIRYPSQQVKLAVDSKLFNDKLIASVMFDSTSSYDVSKSGDQLQPIYSRWREMIDLAFTYKITKNLSTKLTIKNLLATKVPQMTYYGDPYSGAIGEERRYWYLSMKYEF